jgi:DNA-binding response OmpR family regulator
MMAIVKILILEDEYLVAAEFEVALQEWGYEPIGIAPDRRAVLELVVKNPDLAPVVVNLRDRATGPEIGKLLADRGVTVVFVTANPRMLMGAPEAAVGVLTKPCNENLMAAAIDYALKIRDGARLPSPPAGMLIRDDLAA